MWCRWCRCSTIDHSLHSPCSLLNSATRTRACHGQEVKHSSCACGNNTSLKPAPHLPPPARAQLHGPRHPSTEEGRRWHQTQGWRKTQQTSGSSLLQVCAPASACRQLSRSGHTLLTAGREALLSARQSALFCSTAPVTTVRLAKLVENERPARASTADERLSLG